MIGLELICLFITWAYCVIQLALIRQLLNADKINLSPIQESPEISILIPARNESENIVACLQSIHQLNYPLDKILVLVGDDASTDDTHAKALNFASKFPRFKCVKVEKKNGLARAKANVIADLMQYVESEFVFVTDADIQVNPNWIQSLLPYFKEASLISGATIVKPNSLFAAMQSFEWIQGFSNLFAFEKLGIQSTAVGNNMAFTKTAYDASGGYESIPFSVTEDLALTLAFREKNLKIINIASPGAVHESAAQQHLINLLHQRKRWLIGAKALPFKWKLIFMLQGLFLPAFCFLMITHLNLALVVLLAKWTLQFVQMALFNRLIEFKLKWSHFPLFLIYQELVILATVLFYVLPFKMNWKQRKYSIHNEPIN
jgi:cellulose synthase/poly-beta-1,6-N-acetylglucosamine synthase-like glycosyltransferase